jgi:nucleoside-diphosphate-sugar epimerase
MHVEGSNNLFDFTNIVDVGRAMELLTEATARRELLPTVHFATGAGTTLGQLAQLAATYARAPVDIVEAPMRDYDATRFVDDPSRAEQLLGWRANIKIDSGVRDFVEHISRERATQAGAAESQAVV